MNFKPSIILATDTMQNPLQVFVSWINDDTQNSYTIQSIHNQTNITLINTEKESIKIKTVRKLKEQLSYSAYQTNQTRYFVFLDAHLTTIPAQNALLKSIEEPPPNTQIILVTGSSDKLLQTIKSRCQLIRTKATAVTQATSEIATLYTEIITATHGKKITLAATYKERADALELCTKLVTHLHQELKNTETTYTTKQIARNTSRILKTIDQLEHNVNVLLALENCFFELL